MELNFNLVDNLNIEIFKETASSTQNFLSAFAISEIFTLSITSIFGDVWRSHQLKLPSN